MRKFFFDVLSKGMGFFVFFVKEWDGRGLVMSVGGKEGGMWWVFYVYFLVGGLVMWSVGCRGCFSFVFWKWVEMI